MTTFDVARAAERAGILSGTSALQLLVLGGIGLLAMAVAWRAVRLARVRRGVRAGLADSDPRVRVAAVRQAAELGLATTSPALLRAVRAEKDTDVLAAVVETVASRQWEPASTGSIVELRLWARAYLDAHPERCSRGARARRLPPRSTRPGPRSSSVAPTSSCHRPALLALTSRRIPTRCTARRSW